LIAKKFKYPSLKGTIHNGTLYNVMIKSNVGLSAIAFIRNWVHHIFLVKGRTILFFFNFSFCYFFFNIFPIRWSFQNDYSNTILFINLFSN